MLAVLQIPDHPVSQGFVDEHCFMPAHPLCRSLPTFAADKSKGTDGKTCNKFYKKHPGLTPGIFTLFCAHRKCIGFSLMSDQEGRSTAFQLIYNRIKTGRTLSVSCFCSCLTIIGAISTCLMIPAV